MNTFKNALLIQTLIFASAVTLATSPVSAGGFLDKLKIIEKGVSTVTKPPKVQADVGGVKVDVTGCSAKTGVKTIDNATKKKTEDKCAPKKQEPVETAETTVVKKSTSSSTEDATSDR